MSQTKQEIRTWIADQIFIIIPASSIRKTSTEKKESFWKNGIYENGGEKKKKKNRPWGARDLQDININRWRLLEVSEVNGWLCNFFLFGCYIGTFLILPNGRSRWWSLIDVSDRLFSMSLAIFLWSCLCSFWRARGEVWRGQYGVVLGQSVDSEGCWLVVMMMMMMVRITCQPLEIEPLKKSQFQLCAGRIFIGKKW